MAGVAAVITLDDSAWRRTVAGLLAFDQNLRPVADEIGEAMVSATMRRFGAEKGPDGAPWKQSQRARRAGGKTLQDKRRLFNSMVHNVVSGATTAVEWGTNVVYGLIHQLGGTIQKYAQSRPIYRKVKDGVIAPGFVKRKKSNFESWHAQGEHTITMPARPYLGIDAQDQAEISEILGRHLVKAMVARSIGGAP